MYAYVGSFSYHGAEGITICDYDLETGALRPLKTVGESLNAGSLTVRGGHLYSTDEQLFSGETPGGGVVSFDIDPATGGLRETKHIGTLAMNTSSITFDGTGQYMIVTHFAISAPCVKVVRDGERSWHTETVFPDTITSLYRVNADGTPGELRDVYIHPVTDGHKPSFIHKAFQAPGKNLFAYGNLGSDHIGFFRIDYENERLEMLHTAACKDGSGPRHLAFHPTLPYLYLNYEQNGAISRFRYTETECIPVDDTSVLPEGTEMDRSYNQSEILINADGTRLYDLIRGLGQLLVFGIGPDGGLFQLQTVQLMGRTARGASFSPDGKHLLVAETDMEIVVTYQIQLDGTLRKGSASQRIAHPASVIFSQE